MFKRVVEEILGRDRGLQDSVEGSVWSCTPWSGGVTHWA